MLKPLELIHELASGARLIDRSTREDVSKSTGHQSIEIPVYKGGTTFLACISFMSAVLAKYARYGFVEQLSHHMHTITRTGFMKF